MRLYVISAREQQRRAALILRNKNPENIARVSATLNGRSHGPLSLDHRTHIAEALTGHVVSPATRIRLSVAGQRRITSPETRAKQSLAQKGRTHQSHTPETRAKISRSKTGTHLSAEHRLKISLGLKSSEAKRVYSATLIGRPLSAEHRAQLSAALKGKRRGPRSIEHRLALSLSLKNSEKMKACHTRKVGRPRSAETRAKLSATQKGQPRGPFSVEHRRAISYGLKHSEKMTAYNIARIGRPLSIENARAVAKALSHHPNRLERRVLAALIDTFPDAGWKFNDGIVITGKIPDFIRSDRLQLAVDVHGDYWHRDDTPATCQARQRLFRVAGWRLVIVWEREFNQNPLILTRRVRRAERLAFVQRLKEFKKG